MINGSENDIRGGCEVALAEKSRQADLKLTGGNRLDDPASCGKSRTRVARAVLRKFPASDAAPPFVV